MILKILDWFRVKSARSDLALFEVTLTGDFLFDK